MAQVDHEIINTVWLGIRWLKEDVITAESAYLSGSHNANRTGR